jgi:hypothetical protein
MITASESVASVRNRSPKRETGDRSIVANRDARTVGGDISPRPLFEGEPTDVRRFLHRYKIVLPISDGNGDTLLEVSGRHSTIRSAPPRVEAWEEAAGDRVQRSRGVSAGAQTC